MQQSPHWLQWNAPKFTPKLPFPLQQSPPPSNTPVTRLTPLTTLNGIRIQLAVFPQIHFRTLRQTDRWDKRQEEQFYEPIH